MITTVWEHIPGGTESGLQVFSTALFFLSDLPRWLGKNSLQALDGM
jgi:hypothetical protein